jgi:beta-hydroxylase
MRYGSVLLQPGVVILFAMLLSATCVQLRGRVRLKFARQITDHSTFTAPFNALIHLFSRAPSKPFQDLALAPEMRAVTDNWRVFREEGLRLLEEGRIAVATGDNDLGFHTFFRRGWKRFYLKWYDAPLPSALALCPESTAILDGIPSVHGAMFAVLPAGAKLGKHRDPFAGSLRYHLGLATPNSDACWIEVDGERRSWRDGEAMLFDETFVHEARNETDTPRLILFCDVERPVAAPVSHLNRWAIRTIMRATGTQNVEGEPIGAVNRLYGRLARVIAAGKALKARDQKLYYRLKYAAITAVLGLLIGLPALGSLAR